MISAGDLSGRHPPTSEGGAKIGNTKRGFDEKSPGSAAGRSRSTGRRGGAVAEKPAIDIGLATDRLAFLPGEAVTAFVKLLPHEDLEAVECSVALVHVDRYPVGGDGYTDDRAVAGEYVLGEEDLAAGTAREFSVVLPVPRRIVPPQSPEDCADARFPPSGDEADPESYDLWIEPEERWGPPTSVGPGGSSMWLVRCEVKCPGRFPDPVEVPVVVLAQERPMPADPPVRLGGGAPLCTVSFYGLPRTSVAPSAALRGTVRLTARNDIKARGVRVELVRLTTVDSGRGQAVVRHRVSEVAASGPVELRARQPKDLAFTVEVPVDAGPSIVSDGYRVDWLLRAVIDRRLRRDEVWEQAIAVHADRQD
jgi:hypothetical protein